MQAILTPSDVSSPSPTPTLTSSFTTPTLAFPHAQEINSLSSPPTPTMRLLPSPYAQQSSCSECSSRSGGAGVAKLQSPAQLQAVVMGPLKAPPSSPPRSAPATISARSSKRLSGASNISSASSRSSTGTTQQPSWSFAAPHSPAVSVNPAVPAPVSISFKAAQCQPPITRSAAGRVAGGVGLQGLSLGSAATAATAAAKLKDAPSSTAHAVRSAKQATTAVAPGSKSQMRSHARVPVRPSTADAGCNPAPCITKSSLPVTTQCAERRSSVRVVAPSAGPATGRQLAAAALVNTAKAVAQPANTSASALTDASRARKVKKLKPEMPSRVQPVRAAKARWV